MFLLKGIERKIIAVKANEVDRIYVLDGISYKVHIVFRRGRYLRLKAGKEPFSFRLGVPTRTPYRDIDAFVVKSIPKLLKAVAKKSREPYDGQYLYVLGEKREVGTLTREEIKKLYKKECFDLIEARFRLYERQMGIRKPYLFRFRDMKTRLGSNSKATHAITISYNLLAYDLPVIDSVLYHELAHHFHFDHSAKFYKVLLQYCPDYEACRKRILRHDYEGTNRLQS